MQGDILWPSAELRDLFGEVHPHFRDPRYIAFIITTQSCDLVRRKGKLCKAECINLAVIRDLESCLSQFFDSVCEKVSPGVYLKGSRIEAYQLLARILNQNEQALGLFYLHPDTDTIGISDYAVALLRVAIALRAKEHYELLQGARRGRLTGQFRNKLGWLVGNLYSRVGTPDWTDQEDGEKKLNQLIKSLIDSDLYTWVSKSMINAAQKAGICIDDMSPDKVMSTLEKYKPIPFKEQIADAAKEEINKIVSRLPDTIMEDISNELCLDNEIKRKVDNQLSKIIKARISEIPQKLRNRLINNSVISKALSRDELD